MKAKDTHFPSRKTLLDSPIDPKGNTCPTDVWALSMVLKDISSGCELPATESTLG